MLRRLSALRARFPINHNYANALMTGYGLMGVTIIVQLVLVPLYLEHLGKEKFGILVMIMAANNYAAIGITWLSGGMARILAERAATEDIEGFKAGYAFAKWLYVAYALLAVCLFWLVAPWMLSEVLEDKEIVTALVLSSLYLILLYEYNADRAAFIARHWQAKGNLREIVGQLVLAAGVLIGLFLEWGLPGVIFAQILGIVTTRIMSVLYWRADSWSLAWKMPSEKFKEFWLRVSGKMGRDYVVYGILLLTLQADVLLLGWLSNPETVVNYYLLWRIPEVFILLMSRIPGSYGPFLVAMDMKGDHKKLEKNYRRGLYLIMAVAGIAALIYGTLGRDILDLWVGKNGLEGFTPYMFAAISMFFLAVTRWPSGISYSLLNTTMLIRIVSIELAVKLLFIVFLFDDYGFYTPMVATTMAHGLLVFYLYLWLGHSTVKKIENRSYAE